MGHPPSIDALLRHPRLQTWNETLIHSVRVNIIRRCVESSRASGRSEEALLLTAIEKEYEACLSGGMVRVINATGVVLHTNLGRAPIGKELLLEMADEIDRYCSLELDRDTGERGSRTRHLENLVSLLCEVESVAAVNNNAAAVLLSLHTLADKKEVILSRGELVQIGGGFRVPEILEVSGASLVEVGTTNITRLADYSTKCSERTGALMKVHHSNFVITGHAEETGVSELAGLAEEKKIPLIVDLGSGALEEIGGDLSEMDVTTAVRKGASVVCFSGDKLLGGSQAGFIVGKKVWIEKIKKNPLYRALRMGKTECFLLEKRLASYLQGKKSPTWELIQVSESLIERRAQTMIESLKRGGVSARMVTGDSAVGGGSAPSARLPSRLIEITDKESERLFHKLLSGKPSVLARRQQGKLVLDLRTVFSDEDGIVLERLLEASACLS